MGWFGIGKEIDALYTPESYNYRFSGTALMRGFQPDKSLSSKPCIVCNKEFMPYRKNTVHCSKLCGQKTLAKHQRDRKYVSQSKPARRNTMAEWRKNNPAKRILSNLKQRDNLTDITEEWINKKLKKGVCEATGIKFVNTEYGTVKSGFNFNPWAPSVDRINHELGYKKNNCRLVVWAFNRARGKWADEDMIKLAKGILHGMDK